MDKINHRKLRIASALPHADNAGMSEEMHEALFEAACDLAYRTFDEPSDDHIECVYARLVLNHAAGAGEDGAVTRH